MPIDLQLPNELAQLANQPRVLIRREGALREGSSCVVYWMQRAIRILDNPALDVAIEAGNLLGLPVVIYFFLNPNDPKTNLRQFHFMAQGLRDAAEDAAERKIGFVLRRPPGNSLEAFLEEVRAALLIGDENPCRDWEHRRRAIAKRIKLPFWTVDADVVVPSIVFGRAFFLLHHFRQRLKVELPKYLIASPKLEPHYAWTPRKNMASIPLDRDLAEGFKKLDRTVKPIDAFTGGTRSALRRLKEFIEHDLAAYEKTRNHPETKGTSRLSPYLHFGNIGPITIALAVAKVVRQRKAPASAQDRFLDQVIGWRELSILFVRHNPNYDNWECAEPWARRTLVEHGGDTRPARYSLEQMERGETHDELWNAAQREMVHTGWMHNYLRMYWAKKILEWAPDPARAFEWAVKLNDKYELDGHDPNGYAGIAWAIVGKHDRPWFSRPVFGLVRPMSENSIAKKFDARAYIRQTEDAAAQAKF